MTLTPELIIAIGALVAVLFTGVVNIIVAMRTNTVATAANAKVDAVAQTTKSIETHVNSSAAAAAAQLDAALKRIEELTRTVSDQKQVAAVLAGTKGVATETTLRGHDEWERGERQAVAAALQENTEMTKEIRDAVVPKTE